MSRLLSLGFTYKGVHHSFLAKMIEIGDETEFLITLMDDGLKRTLAGNNVITHKDGQLIVSTSDTTTEQLLLKEEIAASLDKYLREKPLTSH